MNESNHSKIFKLIQKNQNNRNKKATIRLMDN